MTRIDDQLNIFQKLNKIHFILISFWGWVGKNRENTAFPGFKPAGRPYPSQLLQCVYIEAKEWHITQPQRGIILSNKK